MAWEEAIELKAQKKARMMKMLNEGKSYTEIGSILGLSQPSVSKYRREIRDEYKKEYLSDFQEMRAREIQYQLDFRKSVRDQWDETHKAAYGNLVLAVSERISRLGGLDAPLKTQDWTDKDYEALVNQYAEERSITKEQAYEEVMLEVERQMEADRQRIVEERSESERGTGRASVPETESVEAERTALGADTAEGGEDFTPTDGGGIES